MTVKNLVRSAFALAICIISFGLNAQQYSGMCFVQAPGSSFPGGGGPSNVTSADFNNDGIQDLAVCNYGSASGKISIFLGNANANGSFYAGTTVPVSYAGYVVTADFNGDGNKDLAVGTAGVSTGGKLYIFLGTGSGTFGTPTIYSNLNYGVIFMKVADVNGDGKQDILYCSFGGAHPFYVCLGSGTGTFTITQNYAGQVDDETCIATGDVNSDTYTDIVFPIGSMTFGTAAEVGYGNGTGTFTPFNTIYGSYPFYNAPFNGNHLAMGDFNEDGKPDIAEIMADPNGTSNTPLNSIFIGLNSGVANAPYTSVTGYSVGNYPIYVGVADFNMDNHQDVIVLNKVASSFCVLAGDGHGNFAAPVYWSVGITGSTNNPYTFTINDFNGDGFPDVAFSNYGSNTITVYLNAMPKVTVPTVATCSGKPVTLNATVTGADTYTYLWSTGSTALSTVVAPTTPTAYNFIATNSMQQCSTTYAAQVNIYPAASAITVAGTSICSGSTAPLSVTPLISFTSYSWLPATGLNTYSGANVTAGPSASTVYTITATNLFGCTYTTSASVVVKPIPTVVVPSQGACVGESVTLTASGASSYAWSPSNSLSSSTGSSVIASPSGTTLYTIVGTASNGCTNSTTASVNIIPRPEIRIGPSTPDSPQHLQPTKFYSSASGSSYVWSVSTAILSSVPFSGQGTSSISSVAWQAPTNIESTLQKVTLKLDGCATSLFLPLNNATGGAVHLCTINGPVTVTPGSTQVYSINCGASLFPGNTWFCDGGTIIAGQGTSSVTIKWGGGYVGRLGYQAVASTGQNSTLDVAICSSTAPVNPSNNSILTPNPVGLCHSAGSMHLTAANTGSTYLWSTGSAAQSIIAPVNSTGYADYYYVTVTNTNGCKSSFFQTVITNLACREAGMSSISEKELHADAMFYPNPAVSKLIFESLDGDAIGKVIITNSLGEIVFEKELNENRAEFDISHFASGVYFVLNHGSKGKLVKE